MTGLYGPNIGRFIEDHPGHRIEGGPRGLGYTAQRIGPRHRPAGKKIYALTLDELAARLAASGQDTPPVPATA